MEKSPKICDEPAKDRAEDAASSDDLSSDNPIKEVSQVETSSTLPDSTMPISYPIVGLVASAGGLDAFKRFFSAMPADSGMAFVLIPHLDPSHESMMVELLSKLTSMPVIEAKQDMEVQVNRIYIIPPSNFLSISGGRLQLSDPPLDHGWQTSIDYFLRSLARDQGERAIGIVLSGTGSHGTLGVREIKLCGGMVMAQQPDTAEYNQMPLSAIASGVIDFVLPPVKCRRRLSTTSSNPTSVMPMPRLLPRNSRRIYSTKSWSCCNREPNTIFDHIESRWFFAGYSDGWD